MLVECSWALQYTHEHSQKLSQTLIARLAIRTLDVNRLVRQDIKLILVLFWNTFNSIYL